jgi:3-oxoacyl-[acyl-carrier-protein] synthase I
MRFAALPEFWVTDGEGEPTLVNGAPIPACLPVEAGCSRLASHGRRALREALADAAITQTTPGTRRLFLGHDPGLDATHLLRALAAELPGGTEAAAFPAGRCAFLVALAAAMGDLSQGNVEIAVVGAADSWVELHRLIELNAAERLLTPKTPDGAIPGEAVGFVVLEPRDAASRRAAKVYAKLAGVGLGQEPTAGTEEPCKGEGLTRALRDALHSAEPKGGRRNLPLMITDLEGNHYRALEWGLASCRAFRLLEGETVEWRPASYIGECGAGIGPVSLAWAATALRRGQVAAREVLVCGSSEGPERAAALLLPEEEAG